MMPAPGVSFTTPTTVAHGSTPGPSIPLTRNRLPIGFSPGHSRSTIARLTTTTGNAPSSSDVARSRPRTMCIPIDAKYPGLATRYAAKPVIEYFGEIGGLPSITTPPFGLLPPSGSTLVTPALSTPGICRNAASSRS